MTKHLSLDHQVVAAEKTRRTERRHRNPPPNVGGGYGAWRFFKNISGQTWVVGLLSYGLCSAAEVKVTEKALPPEIDASFKATLQSKCVQLLEGNKPIFEFWFIAELPLASKPDSMAKALQTIKPTSVIGVVSVHGEHRDYKDNDLHAGVYTMRFGLQPQDGNHLGTAEYPYFVLLVPAKTDSKVDGLTDFKALVKASSKGTASDHPVILSLRPASVEKAGPPSLHEPTAEHKSLRVSVPAKTGNQNSNIAFELVYLGKGQI